MSINWDELPQNEPLVDNEDKITWKPVTKGDTVTGVIRRLLMVTTPFGRKPVLDLGDATSITSIGASVPDAPIATVWPTAGLIASMKAAGVEIDAVIKITLIDLIDTGKGNPAKKFEVTAVNLNQGSLFD